MIKPTRSMVTVPSAQPRQLTHDRLRNVRGGTGIDTVVTADRKSVSITFHSDSGGG